MIEYRIKILNEDLYFTGIEDSMAVNVTTNQDIALVFNGEQAEDLVKLLNLHTDFTWEAEWAEN